MKPFQRLKVVLCFFIFISAFPFGSSAFNNAMDTLIPPTNNVYAQTGYQLSITSIKVDKSNNKMAKIVYNLSNPSRNPVKLGKGRNVPTQLIFNFDQSLNDAGMIDHANAIANAIKNQKVTLSPGQLLMGNKLKVTLNETNSELIVVTPGFNDDTHIVDSNPIQNKEAEINTEIQEPIAEEIIEEQVVVNTPTAETQSQIDLSKPTIVESTTTDKEEILEEVKSETPVITKIPALENTETIILNSPNHKTELPEIETAEIKTTVVEEVEEVSVESNEIVNEKIPTTEEIFDEEIDEEVMQPISTEDEMEEESDEFADAPHYAVDLDAAPEDKDFLEEDICADLVMESVKIIKQSSTSVTLEYVVANYGNGSAAIFGESKKDDDNDAIKAHLSKSRKLTRGSIPLKGAFINKGIKNKSGMLLPKKRVTNTMKIDVSKMTKFTPVLVLSLDGFQDVDECDEFNNTVFINLIEVNEVAYAKPSRPKQETKVLSKVEDEEK